MNVTNHKKRIVFISMHPAPYRDEALDILSRKRGIELTVLNVEQDAWNHKEWQYSPKEFNRFLEKKVMIPVLGQYNPGIRKEIKKHRPDVMVISGYYPFTMTAALVCAWTDRIPYVMTLDTVSTGKMNLLKKAVYYRASAFWVSGKMCRKYLARNGIPGNKVFEGCYTNHVREISKKLQTCDSDRLRAKLQISASDYVFLFIGGLTKFRKIHILMEALEKLEAEEDGFRCIVIGDGKDRPVAEAAKKKLKSLIYMKEVPYSGIHAYYKIADCYVHPGNEPYSLALAEGAIAGLALVATKKTGAVEDFLYHGKNGFYFDGSSDEMAAYMKKAKNREYDTAYIEKVRRFAVKRDAEWAAQQLYQSLQCAFT